MDRQILGILAPELQRDLGWNEIDYGHIVSAFQGAYAVGLLCCGWIIDRIGARWGLILAVSAWSIVSVAHGFAATIAHFTLARLGLGLAESANFPASVKTVSEWFPKKERAFAIGIFNSGSNLGAILAPIIVPLISINFGWRAAFYVLGVIGFFWVAIALILFREPKISEQMAEPATQVSENRESHLSWWDMLHLRETRNFAAAKFLTDPVWWFYLYWTPKYLAVTYGINLSELGLPLIVIYLCADLGSIGGGWLTSRLAIGRLSTQGARRQVMLICALCAPSVIALSVTSNLWLAAFILGLATAAHQGWSANLFSLAADSVPSRGVGSVVGIGGVSGAIGGVILAEIAGYSLQFTGSYLPLFIVCGSAYIIAWKMIHHMGNQKSARF